MTDGSAPHGLSPALRAAVAVIAAASVALPSLVVTNPPPFPNPAPRIRAAARALAARPVRVVPPAELPPVEPVELVALTPDDARAFNASVPFAPGPNPAARPFRFAGAPQELARATDCLAAAVLYEAGDDTVGERAVAQVVLNRLRHPAFPKTVCGVVFQGQERTTGCQFTFTCDGALGRAPSEAGWRRAREVAALALRGAVYRPVGWSTHYHTDWVVPYWSSSLDKVAEVHTHLFFRWSGWWGTPPAFDRARSGEEPVVPKIAFLSEAHRAGAEGGDPLFAEAAAAALAAGPAPVPLAEQESTFLQALPRGLSPDAWPVWAARVCGERAYCKLLAWADAPPAALPVTPGQQARMAFSYLRDRANGFEKPLWNCAQAKRVAEGQCMKVALPTPTHDAGLAADQPLPVTPGLTRGPASSSRRPDKTAGPRIKSGVTGVAVGPVPILADQARDLAPLGGVRRRDAPLTPPGTSPPGSP